MSFNVAINNKVRQSNNLVESPYAQEFTAHEIKIFEIAVASCTASDYELVNDQRDKSFSISNSELAKLLNTKPNVISMEIEKTAARIMKKTMHLRKVLNDGTIEFEMMNIIPFAKYKNGIFQFRLNYSIIPYLLEINKNFTEYQLHFLLSLSSAYSIKLYKLLYQYKNIKTRIFSIDELKEQFGIIDKYPQYKNFKQKIIEPSILQINNQTDLFVSYKEIKFGRKVEKLEFIFEIKKTKISEVKPIEHIEVIANSDINKLTFTIDDDLSSQTKNLLNKYHKEKGAEYVEASINYARRNAKTNLDKYLADTLINAWAEVEVKKNILKKTKTNEKSLALKQEQEKKKLERERENLAKSEVEHEWNKLSDNEKQNYTRYSEFILIKNKNKLNAFKNVSEELPICIYAFSNNKSYNKPLESYLTKCLSVNINLHEVVLENIINK